jgi:hypothetical protein
VLGSDTLKKAKALMTSGRECTDAAKLVLSRIDKGTIQSTAEIANRSLFCAQLFLGFGVFVQAAVGFCAVPNTIFGIAAERHLLPPVRRWRST